MENSTVSSIAPRKAEELTITRIFNAPPELIWKAWTDPEFFKLWWGPRGFTAPFVRIDLRVGGQILACMRGPDGKDIWSTGTYHEIVPMERLVMSDSFADEDGNVVPATYYGMSPEFPLEMTIMVTFQEMDGKTKFTLVHSGTGPLSATDLAGMEQGWSESFDKLGEILDRIEEGKKTIIVAEPGRQDIVVTRELDAPRELVFKAFTDPGLYAQWLRPHGYTMTLEIFEPRYGGRWRYVQHDPEGNEFSFHGVYHEISPPERIIDTFEYEGLPENGHVLLETARFETLPGDRTKLTFQSVFQSVEDRDGMLQSGMKEGVNESYERLDELLRRLMETNV